MSSNELHITRANYEAYFLLYVDGELTPAQSDAVEAFATLHPDLQEELDILLTTKLDAETISFDKTSLMADSMKQNTIDESLLLYIDDELKGEEKKKVEQLLANNTTYQYQHNLLQQTKLSAEDIAYPNKAELYRRTERRIRPIVWTRSAAAAVLVLMASGYFWYQNQHLVSDGSTDIAVNTGTSTPTVTAPGSNNTAVVAVPVTTEQLPVAAATSDKGNSESGAEDAVTANRTSPAVQYTANTVSSSVSEEQVARINVDVARSNSIDLPVATEPVATAAAPQQIINTPVVTTAQPTAYNNKEFITADNSGNDQAVALEKEKRGTVKSFLRKATRIIERRTGIASTNENDELLIGAVAIKLK